MKFPKKARVDKLHHPRIPAEMRPDRNEVLVHSHLDTSAKPPALVATDGLVMAVVPVQVEVGDAPGPVTRLALEAARKNAGNKELAEVTCAPARLVAGKQSYPRPVFSTSYPDYRPLIPAKNEGSLRVALNAKLLWNLAQALGSEGRVLLEIPAAEWDPIRVEPIHGDGVEGAVGVLMQIRKG